METYEIDQYLFSLMGSHELVKKWWTSPNKAFDMQTPLQVWETDQNGPEMVTKYVLSFCYR